MLEGRKLWKLLILLRSQQIRESRDIQPINECVKRRRRKWEEQATRMDAERLKTSRDSIPPVR